MAGNRGDLWKGRNKMEKIGIPREVRPFGIKPYEYVYVFPYGEGYTELAVDVNDNSVAIALPYHPTEPFADLRKLLQEKWAEIRPKNQLYFSNQKTSSILVSVYYVKGIEVKGEMLKETQPSIVYDLRKLLISLKKGIN